QLVRVVKKLKNAGFTVLMDDFGSGYSSLNILKDLAVDVLKLDMKFVQQLETSDRAGIIMKSVVGMAKDLGMEIIVEGVENKKQLDFLQDIGCNMIQGYYFAKPMTTDACLELLMEEQGMQGGF
uniref:EAL domain-containing protein n=1 Tax=Anaerovibrio sp. TaxID=1872532 RepID=UPI0025FB9429